MTSDNRLNTIAHENKGSAKPVKYAVTEKSANVTIFSVAALFFASAFGYGKEVLYPRNSAQSADPEEQPGAPVEEVVNQDSPDTRFALLNPTELDLESEASPAEVVEDELLQFRGPISSGRAQYSRKTNPEATNEVPAPSGSIPSFNNDNEDAPIPLSLIVGPSFQNLNPQRASNPQSPASSDDDESGEDSEEDRIDNRRLNRAPTTSSTVQFDDLLIGTAMVIAVSDLLLPASDADADVLSVSGLSASSGELIDYHNGYWLFIPEDDSDSEVTFDYTVSDGQEGVQQSALLQFRADTDAPLFAKGTDEPLYATNGSNVIVGSQSADLIFALGGDDLINAGLSEDVVFGGAGNDLINAGDGDDYIDAGSGDDIVYAGLGNDVVRGGAGDDQIFGEAGNDEIFGDDGSDLLVGGDGEDQVFGGLGNDEFVATVNDDDDFYDGGAGNDTLNVSGAQQAVAVDLHEGTANGEDIGNDTLQSIENVIGGSGDDEILGDQFDNVLQGGHGKDSVLGGAGHDEFIASVNDDDDVYDGGSGTDTFNASGVQNDVEIDLQEGTATGDDIGFDKLSSIENVIGGDGNDTIVANDKINVFNGGEGDDTFVFLKSSLLNGFDPAGATEAPATNAPNIEDNHLEFGQPLALQDEDHEEGNEISVSSDNTEHDDDVMAFTNLDFASDLSKQGYRWDKIDDFSVGDRIDLRKIDADEGREGHQEFDFKKAELEFTGSGQIKLEFRLEDDDRKYTFVVGNFDDDLDADFVLEVIGQSFLTIENFYGITNDH